MAEKTSRISGFYKKDHTRRLERLQEFALLSEEERSLLASCQALDFETANRMIENVVSVFPVPLGIAVNFIINNKEYLIPMATEEASVIAAASFAAKLARPHGGFTATASTPMMIGQLQIKHVPDVEAAIKILLDHKEAILACANSRDPELIAVGGGARDVTMRPLKTVHGTQLIMHLIVDVQDAMGANIVNGMAETVAPLLEKLTKGIVSMRIVSNLATSRMVCAKATWLKKDIGTSVIDDILDAYAWAQVDPYRCATHNKGIMNGIDAVALATGNDFRAIEAGAHAYAALHGYKPLTHYYKDEEGNLVGELELPLAVGVIGGVIRAHPIAKISLKILTVQSAADLACIMAAVGLAQNFAALRALVCEGIVTGHMRLHSKNIAITAGVPKDLVDYIAQCMIAQGNISVGYAKKLLAEHTNE